MNGRKVYLISVKTGDEGSSPGRLVGDACQGGSLSAAYEGWRLKGGWSLWEAGVLNAGTLPSDAKRKATSGRPARAKVPMRMVRGGVTRSSDDSLGNLAGAKGWPPLSCVTTINKQGFASGGAELGGIVI